MARLLSTVLAVSCFLAVTSAQELERVSLTCPEQKCETGPTGDLSWSYGSSGRGGNLVVSYNADGTYSLKIEGRKPSSSNHVVETVARLGTCALPVGSVIQLTAKQFVECAFNQQFNEASVHRSITLEVNQRFSPAGAAVALVGYRRIDISFTLVLENPETKIVPLDPPVQEGEDRKCADYNHQIQVHKLDNCTDFAFTLTAENYNPASGLGFQIIDCTVNFLKVDGTYTTLDSSPKSYPLVVQGKLARPWEVVQTHVQPGSLYYFQWLPMSPRSDVINKDAKPQIECSVCLCDMTADGALDQCPQDTVLREMEVDARSAEPMVHLK